MLEKRQRRRSPWTPWVTVALLLLAAPLVAATADDHQKEMTAEVVSVDTEAGTLTVVQMDAETGEVQQAEEYEAEKDAKKMKGKKWTLVVGDSTQISEDGGNRIALADLEPGEFVNIVYQSDGSTMEAVNVERSSGE